MKTFLFMKEDQTTYRMNKILPKANFREKFSFLGK